LDCPDNFIALQDLILNYTLTKLLSQGKDLFKDSEDIDLSVFLLYSFHFPMTLPLRARTGFPSLYTESLSEALLKAECGGAVAVWASSGLTEPEAQAMMNRELIKVLFNGESITLGEAIKRAKAATPDPDVRRTWILFGDPTTKLKN